MDANIEHRFMLLKKRLDALHYCQPLNIGKLYIMDKLKKSNLYFFPNNFFSRIRSTSRQTFKRSN